MVEIEEGKNSCELFGTFGLFIQALLGAISIVTLVAKKFMPGETRPWKVFCLDIWKLLFSSILIHFLNILFAVYLD